MLYLRADTITEVTIGPAVAVGDGFTPVTSLTIASADEAEFIKHGATTATAIGGTLAAITNADGYYALDISATDTNTEGRLVLLINDDSLILPIRHEFMVVNTNVFDSLFASSGTDKLEIDLIEMVGVTQSATDLKDFADEGYDPATNKVQGLVLADTLTTYTGDTPQTGDNFARLGTPAGASVSADILEIEAQTRKIKKNEAFSDLTFLMVDATTKDPKTGLTITEEISKDAGAFAAAAGTAAEIANGIYQMDATAADMNADILVFRFSATGADDTFITIVTKP